jgi:hypothetical protein
MIGVFLILLIMSICGYNNIGNLVFSEI